jgi:hypothetical protein
MASCEDLVSNTNLCPKCGRKGWLVSYNKGKTTWCYIPRTVAEALLDARVLDTKKGENVTGVLSR